MDAADVQLDLTSSQISNMRLIDASMFATTQMSSSAEKEKSVCRWKTVQNAFWRKNIICNFLQFNKSQISSIIFLQKVQNSNSVD